MGHKKRPEINSLKIVIVAGLFNIYRYGSPCCKVNKMILGCAIVYNYISVLSEESFSQTPFLLLGSLVNNIPHAFLTSILIVCSLEMLFLFIGVQHLPFDTDIQAEYGAPYTFEPSL